MHLRVCGPKDPEYLICKSLSNARNTLEIENHFFETIQTSDNAFRLGTGNEVLIAVLRQKNGCMGFREAKLVVTACVSVENFL